MWIPHMNLYAYMWNEIVDVDDDIEMRWLLMLMKILRWDDIDVDDIIMMDVCCVCI